MFCRQHIDVNLFDFRLFVEIGNNSFGAEADRLIGMDVSPNHLVLDLHAF